MLEQAQLDQWEGHEGEPLFVSPGLYGEIEKHIEECRPVVGHVPNPIEGEPDIALLGEYEWEAEAVAPMICGREVYNTAWVQAPSAEERENAIDLQMVLGTGAPHAEGVEVGFMQGDQPGLGRG